MFFITGLPRSRTAWFAAFMTASGFPCMHEGMNGCKTIKEYKLKIKNKSDSNTGLFIVKNPYPKRRMLIIHRKNRMNNVAGMENGEQQLLKLNGLHVNFNDINKRIDEIFYYLTLTKINKDIYNLFKHLNIQTTEQMDVLSASELSNATN